MMRKIFVIWTLFMTAATFAAVNPIHYSIKAQLPEMFNGACFTLSTITRDSITSGTVTEGILNIEGSYDKPCVVQLVTYVNKFPYVALFILENGETNIAIEGKTLKAHSGWRTQRLNALSDSLMRHIGEKEARNSIIRSYVMKNTDNAGGGYQLLLNKRLFSKEEMDSLFSVAGEELLSEPSIIRHLQTEERAKIRETGKPYTDFVMNDQNDKPHHLSEYIRKGRLLFVDFWSSWCRPCRAEMPFVKNLYEKYHDKGLDIVGVSLDMKKEQWIKAIDEIGLEWPQLSDLKGWKCEVAHTYGIGAIPCNVLINGEGVIIANNLHGDELAQKLEELMK